ncbi:uncharacterized protein LOC111692709 [Anoplophora glabripennis]|uniref:uncharacterized protein LOC111692709 n=1 Tax=Anoplophora glabripennis TaxID=217634 RepID=UPI000A14082B|nr:uncharacterized protein LOC111692709 [Anoplophora glabripennis]
MVNILHVQVTYDNSDFDIKTFWELETIGIKQPTDQIEFNTDKFINENITFKNSRYTVNLPWIEKVRKLDSNYIGALNRVKSLTKKLIRNETLLEYDRVIGEYLKNDCSELALLLTKESEAYYMPHRHVYRDDKETIRIRCVYDASAHMPGFPSLNNLLCTGENLIPLLLTILINFRIGKIGLTADIEKAFLQIELNESERNYHRFLWYDKPVTDSSKLPNLTEYRMKRVTFGVTCSPFLLAATLRKHLTTQPVEFQQVSDILLKSFYVDDLVVQLTI